MHQKSANYAEILKISAKIYKNMQNTRKYAINWRKLMYKSHKRRHRVTNGDLGDGVPAHMFS